MTGVTSTQFKPGEQTTRAMMATILYRINGSTNAGTASFRDIPKDAWYNKAVAWATKNNIVTGYGGNLFGPNDWITREQMVTMLYRYAGSPKVTGDLNGDYSDWSLVSPYARDAMQWALQKGLIQGIGANELGPQIGATRAEIATIIQRFCEMGFN